MVPRGKTTKDKAGPPLPDFVPPQLALLVDKPPAGSAWIHEIKYDGYRGEIAVAGGRAAFYTRRGLNWTARFPSIIGAASKLECRSALLDGELVALDDKGVSNFSTLQAAIGAGRTADLVYFAFDLLHLDGRDLTAQPLLDRKDALRKLLTASSSTKILYSEHYEGGGKEFFIASCEHGLEGIVSKPAIEPYHPGRRDRWCKIKCGKRQEFVVGGWLPREGDEKDLAALLVGYFDRGKLHYAGRVGTGFNTKTRKDLIRSLTAIKRDTDPFVETPREDQKRARWADPSTVVEVRFTEFTSDGILRHATFMGVREDKSAAEVRLEVPRPVPTPGAIAGATSRWRKPAKR